MDIEQFRTYCLSLPLATEDFPFDETTLVFRVLGKIFAMTDLDRPAMVILKCASDYALALRERYPGIEGAYHMNKRYWNQIALDSMIADEVVTSLVRHSYSEVAKKLTRRERAAHPEITSIGGEQTL